MEHWAEDVHPITPGVSFLYLVKSSENCECFRGYIKVTLGRIQPAIICSKLTRKNPERHHCRCSGICIVNFEHISHLVLVCLLLTLSK